MSIKWSQEIQQDVFKKMTNLLEREQFILLVKEPEIEGGAHLISNSPPEVVLHVLEKMVGQLKKRRE